MNLNAVQGPQLPQGEPSGAWGFVQGNAWNSTELSWLNRAGSGKDRAFRQGEVFSKEREGEDTEVQWRGSWGGQGVPCCVVSVW